MSIFKCDQCEDLIQIFILLKNEGIYEIEHVQRGCEFDEFDHCPSCNSKIEMHSYVIRNFKEFASTIGKVVGRILSEKEIAECEYCNESIILYEQRHGDPLLLDTVEELVMRTGIKNSKILAEIYKNINCSTCSSPMERQKVYVSDKELSYWFKEDVKFIIETFDMEYEETTEYMEFLLRYPMLGTEHPVGKQIFEKINKREMKGISTLKKGMKLYRGRVRSDRKDPYVEKELWNPPKGLSSHGRYNLSGLPALYLADTIEVVLKELNLVKGQYIDIAEFLVIKDCMVFDTRNLDISIFTSIPSFNDGKHLKEEYMLPNFIAQCLKKCGFNGVIYSSTKTEEGYNLCLFDFKPYNELLVTKIYSHQDVQVIVGEKLYEVAKKEQDIQEFPF